MAELLSLFKPRRPRAPPRKIDSQAVLNQLMSNGATRPEELPAGYFDRTWVTALLYRSVDDVDKGEERLRATGKDVLFFPNGQPINTAEATYAVTVRYDEKNAYTNNFARFSENHWVTFQIEKSGRLVIKKVYSSFTKLVAAVLGIATDPVELIAPSTVADSLINFYRLQGRQTNLPLEQMEMPGLSDNENDLYNRESYTDYIIRKSSQSFPGFTTLYAFAAKRRVPKEDPVFRTRVGKRTDGKWAYGMLHAGDEGRHIAPTAAQILVLAAMHSP